MYVFNDSFPIYRNKLQTKHVYKHLQLLIASYNFSATVHRQLHISDYFQFSVKFLISGQTDMIKVTLILDQ